MKYLTISTILTLLQHGGEASSANNVILQPAGSADTPINVVPKNYTDSDGTLLQGFLSLPDDDDGTKKPAVIILQDSDGVNDYEKQRASILSGVDYGYVGFAADLFGYYTELPPEDAGWFASQQLIMPFFNNATLFSQRIQAAIDYVQSLDMVDPTKVALIGYCFGGTGVVHYLNKMGETNEGVTPLAAAIGVHPSLSDWPSPDGKIDIPSLFLTGGADFLTGPESMSKLESDLEQGGAVWEMVRYSGINHAFSRWYGENYDARVDARSWDYSMNYLKEMFGQCNGTANDCYDSSTSKDATPVIVKYTDASDGVELSGRLFFPEVVTENAKTPVVIIVSSDPDTSTGPAMSAAGKGYVAFQADTSSLSSDSSESFRSRIVAAINYVKSIEQGIDQDKIAIMGIGDEGGVSVFYYTMSDDIDTSVKAIAIVDSPLSDVANSTMVIDALSMSDGDSGGFSWGGGGSVSWGSSDETTTTEWGGGDGTSSAVGWSQQGGTSWPQGGSGEETVATWGGGNRRQQAVHKPQILIQSSASENMEDMISIEKAMIALGMNYEITRYSTASPGYDFDMWHRNQLKSLLAEVFYSDDNSTMGYDEEPSVDVSTDGQDEPALEDSAPINESIMEDSSAPSVSVLGTTAFASIFLTMVAPLFE